MEAPQTFADQEAEFLGISSHNQNCCCPQRPIPTSCVRCHKVSTASQKSITSWGPDIQNTAMGNFSHSSHNSYLDLRLSKLWACCGVELPTFCGTPGYPCKSSLCLHPCQEVAGAGAVFSCSCSLQGFSAPFSQMLFQSFPLWNGICGLLSQLISFTASN